MKLTMLFYLCAILYRFSWRWMMIYCTHREIEYQCSEFSRATLDQLLVFPFLGNLFLSYGCQLYIISYDVLVFYCCCEFHTVFGSKKREKKSGVYNCKHKSKYDESLIRSIPLFKCILPMERPISSHFFFLALSFGRIWFSWIKPQL